MTAKRGTPTRHGLSPKKLKELRDRSKLDRAQFAGKPSIETVLTPDELDCASPFYFELRGCVAAMKQARERLGLTLADVAQATGIAKETLSRIETGAATNPTWQTLGKYAVAVGLKLQLTAD